MMNIENIKMFQIRRQLKRYMYMFNSITTIISIKCYREIKRVLYICQIQDDSKQVRNILKDDSVLKIRKDFI